MNQLNKAQMDYVKAMITDGQWQERTDKTKFYSFKSNNYHDICQYVHGDMFPDDFKYDYIACALSNLANMDGNIDSALELTDNDTDIYYSELLKWISSHTDRAGYFDDAVNDGLINTSNFNLLDAIKVAQYVERDEVLMRIVSWLEEHVKGEDND